MATPRRSQEQRSQATRRKLINATLACLESEGYAGTTVSKIVSKAGVSRGAHVHHFPSKAALIEASAHQLIKQIYREMGELVAQMEDSDDRLRTMAFVAWEALLHSREHTVLMELTQASRHDEELATAMKRLAAISNQLIQVAAEHYFEPVHPGDDATAMILLLLWQLRGMAMEIHLLDDPQAHQPYIEQLCSLLSTRIRPRPVTGKPPRPPEWTL